MYCISSNLDWPRLYDKPLHCIPLINLKSHEFDYDMLFIVRNISGVCKSAGQDGGIGRNPVLPCTTKRRITTNLKSMNNQNRQKSKLHGTLTTKELKKKWTRPVRRQTLEADSEKPQWGRGPGRQGRLWWGGELCGWGQLKGTLSLRADCGLQQLPQWEKLPVLQRVCWKVH